MVLAFHIVLMVLDKLVLVRKFKEDGEQTEKLLYYFRVAFLYSSLLWGWTGAV